MSGDHCRGPIDAEPAPQAAPDRAPRVDDGIRAANETGSGHRDRRHQRIQSCALPIRHRSIRCRAATSPRSDATHDTGCLAVGLENVQPQAVDGLDLNGDVPAKGVGGGAYRSHGAGHGLPVRRHVTAAVVPVAIRRLLPESGTASAMQPALDSQMKTRPSEAKHRVNQRTALRPQGHSSRVSGARQAEWTRTYGRGSGPRALDGTTLRDTYDRSLDDRGEVRAESYRQQIPALAARSYPVGQLGSIGALEDAHHTVLRLSPAPWHNSGPCIVGRRPLSRERPLSKSASANGDATCPSRVPAHPIAEASRK